MLASRPVRTTAGAVLAVAAGALALAAVFFARGTTLSSLVWLGAVALLLAALAAAAASRERCRHRCSTAPEPPSSLRSSRSACGSG